MMSSAMNRSLPETLAALLLATSILCAAPQVSLLTDADVGQPASHGLAVLEQALRARGLDVRRHVGAGAVQGDLVVLAGLSQSNSRAASALAAANVVLPVGPEALTVRRTTYQGK